MTTNQYSKTPQPAVQLALKDLYNVAVRALEEPLAPRGPVARIVRASMNAKIEVALACRQRHAGNHFARASDAVATCFEIAELLCVANQIGQTLFEKITGLVDQILAGLADLAQSGVDNWERVSLPPLPVFTPAETQTAVTGAHEIRARVAEVIKRCRDTSLENSRIQKKVGVGRSVAGRTARRRKEE